MQDTIAVIFDFDDTLAPDSTSSFLDSVGIDVPAFWNKEVEPLLEAGWDPVLSYLYKMIEKSRSVQPPLITKQKLAQYGKQIRFYNGVMRMFKRLQQHADSGNTGISVEFYLISSGIGEILRNTRIAKQFTDIWACDFHYDQQGGIVFPRNIVSFTDKTRYLFHIAKGLVGSQYKGKPFEVNRKVEADAIRIPFSQMIFVGDGYTDIPCFSLVKNQGGIALGVYGQEDRQRWGRAWGFLEDGRVSNLAPANYGQNTALSNSLIMAINRIAEGIALRNSTYQG